MNFKGNDACTMRQITRNNRMRGRKIGRKRQVSGAMDSVQHVHSNEYIRCPWSNKNKFPAFDVSFLLFFLNLEIVSMFRSHVFFYCFSSLFFFWFPLWFDFWLYFSYISRFCTHSDKMFSFIPVFLFGAGIPRRMGLQSVSIGKFHTMDLEPH